MTVQQIGEHTWQYRILATDTDTFSGYNFETKKKKSDRFQNFTIVKAFYRTSRELEEIDLDNIPEILSTILEENPEYLSISHIVHPQAYEPNSLTLQEFQQELNERNKAFKYPFIYANTFYPVMRYLSKKNELLCI
jgi:hypothetical protein